MKEALPRTFEQYFFRKKQNTETHERGSASHFLTKFFRKKQNNETHERGSASHFLTKNFQEKTK